MGAQQFSEQVEKRVGLIDGFVCLCDPRVFSVLHRCGYLYQ